MELVIKKSPPAYASYDAVVIKALSLPVEVTPPKEAGRGRGWEWPMLVDNNNENGGAMANVHQLFNSGPKLQLFYVSALSWERELGQIKKSD